MSAPKGIRRRTGHIPKSPHRRHTLEVGGIGEVDSILLPLHRVRRAGGEIEANGHTDRTALVISRIRGSRWERDLGVRVEVSENSNDAQPNGPAKTKHHNRTMNTRRQFDRVERTCALLGVELAIRCESIFNSSLRVKNYCQPFLAPRRCLGQLRAAIDGHQRVVFKSCKSFHL